MEDGSAGPGVSSVKLKVSLDPSPAGEVGEAGRRLAWPSKRWDVPSSPGRCLGR